jgi:hypothetical protein
MVDLGVVVKHNLGLAVQGKINSGLWPNVSSEVSSVEDAVNYGVKQVLEELKQTRAELHQIRTELHDLRRFEPAATNVHSVIQGPPGQQRVSPLMFEAVGAVEKALRAPLHPGDRMAMHQMLTRLLADDAGTEEHQRREAETEKDEDK